MSMSGKTFLAAFQVGSRLVPDEIDRRVSRKKTNLQKDLLEIEKKAKDSEKIRRTEGVKSYNDWDREIKELDKDSPFFPRQYADITSKYIGGISLWPQAYTRYENTDNAIKEDARFKGKVDAVNELVVVNDWWNKTNKGDPVNIFEVDDAKRIEINKAYKDHINEEKKGELTRKLITEGEVKSQLEDQASFNTFVKETGSDFKPEDFNNPDAKNAMRVHNQLKEVEELVVEAGTSGIPILRKLAIKEDGTGYRNLVDVKSALQDVINENKKSEKRSGKSLSEAEGNSLMYSERMRFNNKTIDQMFIEGAAAEERGEKNSFSPNKDFINGLIAKATQDSDFSIGNALLDDDFQMYKVAADNFIRAVLRKESGAAIAANEYIGAFRDYLPLYGDSDRVVEQKRDLRRGITNTMRKISGVPWDDSEFKDAPLKFPSLQSANDFKTKGWLLEGDTAEYYDEASKQYVPFTVGKAKPKKK
jgi:hypothetical protein